YYYELNSIRQI
uniref:Uncharacterized protein n=1 Tax=Amphimedon queenslandica TaxID=400682 RepID=A0A1X7V2A1_AMPQE